MYKKKTGTVQLILLLLVWMLLFATPVLFGNFENGINWTHISKIWKEYSILFLIFIVNRFVLMPHLFFKGKRVWYFISVAAIILLFAFVLIYLQHYVLTGPTHGPHQPLPPADLGRPPRPNRPREFIPPYANHLIMSILLIGFDSSLMFFSKWMQSEQNKLKVEKESIKNKMAFLQNQISPHFFMNTLNNIHALVDIDKEEAKDSIINLSHMMDFMLHESQSAKITLQQELEFIKSYVELMKLRFTDDIELILDIPETIPSIKIPPLLSISFIENAFKYGVSYQAPSFIHIHIAVDDRNFNFRVTNSIHKETERRKNSGIGITNTRNRLDLIYGNTYNLDIDNTGTEFEVNLTLPL